MTWHDNSSLMKGERHGILLFIITKTRVNEDASLYSIIMDSAQRVIQYMKYLIIEVGKGCLRSDPVVS